MDYATYFAQRDRSKPTPKFAHGTRVFAKFSGVPVAGTVIREQSNRVLIHLDLPVQINKVIHCVVWAAVKDARKMKELTA
jgi:hypothetical protein